MKKQCRQCELEKDISMFYKYGSSRDGRMHICKECKKENVYANRELKKEVYREKKREYDRLPHVVAKRLEYAKSPAGRASQRRHRRWRKLVHTPLLQERS